MKHPSIVGTRVGQIPQPPKWKQEYTLKTKPLTADESKQYWESIFRTARKMRGY